MVIPSSAPHPVHSVRGWCTQCIIRLGDDPTHQCHYDPLHTNCSEPCCLCQYCTKGQHPCYRVEFGVLLELGQEVLRAVQAGETPSLQAFQAEAVRWFPANLSHKFSSATQGDGPCGAEARREDREKEEGKEKGSSPPPPSSHSGKGILGYFPSIPNNL